MRVRKQKLSVLIGVLVFIILNGGVVSDSTSGEKFTENNLERDSLVYLSGDYPEYNAENNAEYDADYSDIDENECFQLVKNSDGKVYELTKDRSNRNSILKFSFKNICKTAQSLANLSFNIRNWRINGKLYNSSRYIYIRKRGPVWIDYKFTGPKDSKTIYINECFTQEKCDKYRKIRAGREFNFTLTQLLKKGRIKSHEIEEFSLSQLPSRLAVKIDTSDLRETCTLNQNCNIQVNILRITNSPTATDSNKLYTSIYINPLEAYGIGGGSFFLPSGKYKIEFNDSTFPSGGIITYDTDIFTYDVINGSFSYVEMKLSFSAKKATTSDVSLIIRNIPSKVFKKITGNVTSNSNSESEDSYKKIINFSYRNSAYMLKNLKIGSEYNVFVPGIIIPVDGLFYEKINSSFIVKDNIMKPEMLLYDKIKAGIYHVEFRFKGYEGRIRLEFISESDEYVYNSSNIDLVNNISKDTKMIGFLKSQSVEINIREVSGYTISFSTTVITEDVKVVVVSIIKK